GPIFCWQCSILIGTLITVLIVVVTVIVVASFRCCVSVGSSPSAPTAAGGSVTIHGPLVSSAPAAPGAAAIAATPTIRAAWAQLVPKDTDCVASNCEVRILLRTIVPLGASCAGLARSSKGNQPIRLQKRENRVPDRFPIDVCEGLLALDQEGANLADESAIRWTGLASGPRVVSIIGDTGCQDSELQNCNALPMWPLANVAAEAAWLKGVGERSPNQPDLVIHVGDYRYRGRDEWSYWQVDFFEAARTLMLAAPWVMVRGNHENCYKEDGVGWAFLLSPSFGRVPD